MKSDMLSALKQYFGFNQLRPAQEPVMESILAGHDTLTIMPTGGGKSLCYQLPAVMNDGLVLVISPLIALMHDQVQSLLKNGISAGMLNSSQSRWEQTKILDGVEEKKVDILYISPEKLFSENGSFMKWLTRQQIQLIAIDEAHCVSQWGHDFRPEYTRLSILKKEFPKTPVLALTATADELTREDIVKQLELKNPQVFISSFDRPNITYTVQPKADADKASKQLISFIQSYPGQSGIVYCLSRKSTSEVADKLIKAGIKAAPFHAGLTPETKTNTYDDFMQDKIQVVCATIAFGMGVDKPDVRFVVHWNMPKSIESYYQETGRAGRDGADSEALLLFNPGDASTYRRFIDLGKPSGSLVNFEVHQKLQHDKLDRLVDFCNTGHCRRRILLQYFDQTLPEDCGNCDACLNPVQKLEGTEIAQKIISAIARTDQKYGIGYITDILLGTDNDRITANQHHKLPTFGVCSEYSKPEMMYFINQLVSLGMIKVNYEGYIKTLALNTTSYEIVQDNRSVELTPYEEKIKKTKVKKAKRIHADLSESEGELFEQLRERRRELAKEDDVPAFVIFSNASLLSMVEIKPSSKKEFSQVSGVGQKKLDKYWPLFKDILEN